jgi:hypothetical protein
MNKSYSKLRHTNNTNYLLEQRYLEDKRRTDLGVLSEQLVSDINLTMLTTALVATKGSGKLYDVILQYKDQVAASKTLNQVTKDSIKQWLVYPCILKSKDVTPRFKEDGTLVFDNDKDSTIYYAGGRFYNWKTKKSESYYCNKDAIIRGDIEPDEYIKQLNASPNRIGDLLNQDISKMPLPQATKDSITTWKKFPCVMTSGGIKIMLSPDNTILFVGGGRYWYNTGKSVSISDQSVGDYHCGSDGRIAAGLPKDGKSDSNTDTKNTGTEKQTETSTTQPTTNQTQQVSGMGYIYQNVFTPNVVTDLRGKIGSTDTSKTLSQTDINLLYDKLSKI